jgi:glycerol uptake facilitator-like aquaporin
MSCGLPDCDECVGDIPNAPLEPSYTALIAHSARLHPECSAGDWVKHPYGECTARWTHAIIEGKPADETDKRYAILARRHSRVPAMGRKLNPWFYTIVGGFLVFALVVVGFYYG